MKQINLYVEKTTITNDSEMKWPNIHPHSPRSVHKNAYSCICVYIIEYVGTNKMLYKYFKFS